MLNITASQRNQRMSPFEGFNGGDLNRCFPGNADGTFTDQMAYRDLLASFAQHATTSIDFHTAFTPDTRWALFANAPGDRAQGCRGDGARLRVCKSTLPAPLDILGGSR